MTLAEHYRQTLAARHLQEDPAQLAVIAHLQRIADQLAAPPPPAPGRKSLLARLLPPSAPEKAWIPGLYCHGGVGRGKTLLMDLFTDWLPTARKRRRHYHRFMLELHDALNAARHTANPVDHIVKNLSADIDILCLDEFSVSDITDAMLLDRLLNALKTHGITLVTTSNIPPAGLYRNGLQRERFLPAIAWIEENLTVHRIPDGEDYRRRHYSQADILRADSPENRAALQRDLLALTGEPPHPASHYHAGSRAIPILMRNTQGIAFAFDPLCTGHYSQKDYIDIARRFAYAGLTGVPVLDENQEDAARRFLLLIDEFYDRGVKLLLTAAAPAGELYRGKKLAFEYARLHSRLTEMQSAAYWQTPHRP